MDPKDDPQRHKCLKLKTQIKTSNEEGYHLTLLVRLTLISIELEMNHNSLIINQKIEDRN